MVWKSFNYLIQWSSLSDWKGHSERDGQGTLIPLSVWKLFLSENPRRSKGKQSCLFGGDSLQDYWKKCHSTIFYAEIECNRYWHHRKQTSQNGTHLLPLLESVDCSRPELECPTRGRRRRGREVDQLYDCVRNVYLSSHWNAIQIYLHRVSSLFLYFRSNYSKSPELSLRIILFFPNIGWDEWMKGAF